jgi:hypothetical protein
VDKLEFELGKYVNLHTDVIAHRKQPAVSSIDSSSVQRPKKVVQANNLNAVQAVQKTPTKRSRNTHDSH